MIKKHGYPEEVVEEGEKYLDPGKISFVKWGELEKFLQNSSEHSDFKNKVDKYCTWKALITNVLTDNSNKGFYLYNGKNPSIEGLPLFFKELSTIQEYRKETAQRGKCIALILD